MNPTHLLIILLSLVGLVAVYVAVLISRRRALSRRPGAVECTMHVGAEKSRPRWRLGFAVLGVESFQWFPLFGLYTKPALTLPRADIEIAARRAPEPTEEPSLQPGAIVVDIVSGGFAGAPRTFSCAIAGEPLAAFSSWLESAPPGLNHSMGRFT
ncbi:DUF2550 domain-containing protein [Brevibacterium sp. 91QC2O2]|uniref:DUF2550 domain-containing protein n=1 Tax=Brevibacterium sp. 91QC2O2 TaxID=2968458 RepID=UPI00211CE61F|nr:DUF2550 domain-containing protein [Brevibacterium sp. 91QC2O2]